MYPAIMTKSVLKVLLVTTKIM